MELDELITRFEACTLSLSEWNHAAHLAVACHYLSTRPFDEALACVREGIQRYNASQGIARTRDSGYHETLTVFFVRVIGAFLCEPGVPADVEERTRLVRARFAEKRVVFEHYSRERIGSWEARIGWVEPDLSPLPPPPSFDL